MRAKLAAILLAVPFPALAQQAPDPEQIVVTGRGLDAPPGEAAYAVVEIDSDRLDALASGRIEDALRDVAGVAQFRRSDARSAHPTSQGITLRGLGGNSSSRALLLLDGVPQSDPFGGWVAFPAYLPERLASIRVIRGGGSGYAGPGALAGTVELTSVTPGDTGRLSARVLYGSRASVDLAAVASAPLGRGSVTLAGQIAQGDGFIPVVAGDRGTADRPADYAQSSLSLRAVTPIGAATELQTQLAGFRDRRNRGVDFTDVTSSGVDASVRAVHRGAWGWSALGYVQTRTFASGFASVDDARDAAAPALDQYHVPSTGIGGRFEVAPPIGQGFTLRIGGDARRVSGRTRERYLFTDGVPARRRVAGGASTTAGLFADASLETSALTMNLGGRVDRWTIGNGSLEERALAGGAAITDTRFADRSGWQATGRAGAALHAGGGVTLRGAAYRGWRLPTLNELYRPYRVGADATAANADLAPERSTGAEIGLDWQPSPGLSLRVTGYWTRIDDAIANVTLANGPGNFPGAGFVSAAGVYRQRRNLDAVTSHGVEFDGSWRLGVVTLSASYALIDARVSASGVAAPLDGLRPAQTARHQASATLAWDRGGWGASLTGRYAGPQYEDDQNQRLLAEAVTFDAAASMPLTPLLSLIARGENLADARVEAGVSGGDVVERASPRTLWVGLRYRLR